MIENIVIKDNNAHRDGARSLSILEATSEIHSYSSINCMHALLHVLVLLFI